MLPSLRTLGPLLPLSSFIAAWLALGAGLPAALADERALAVDPAASTVTVYAYKDGLLSSLGHDHTIAARNVTGTVTVDPARPEGGRVSFTVPVRSLEVLDPGVSDDDRASVARNMHADVLETEKHPTIEFRSVEVRRSARTAAAPGKPGTTVVEIDVLGDLTIRGTTKRVTLPVTLTLDAGTVRARGEVTIDQPDFGIEPYSALLGAIKVRRDVKIAFDVVAKAK